MKFTLENEEIKRRKKIVARIIRMRNIYKGVDLAKIVISERDKEHQKWKK